MKIEPPQLIIYNCKIYNQSESQTALAISGDKIPAIGSDTDILPLANSQTKKINGGGKWILPALMDSHTHVVGYAARKLQVDLSDCESLNEALKKIKFQIESSPESDWITGGGWDKNKWNLPEFPHKQMLNEISTKHLIALDSKDWHSLWVNSPVLKKCGINRSISDPNGGHIIRDESGEPTGTFQETARQLIFDKIPLPPAERLMPALQETFAEFHRFGITAVHSMETFSHFLTYQQLYREGNLGLRIFWYLPGKELLAFEELDTQFKSGNSYLKICGVKLFADGALGSQSAEMLENYQGLDHAGIGVLPGEELYELIGKCISKNLSCAIHAIGDRANRKVLTEFGEHLQESREAGLRHRIEHAQLLHSGDIPLFQKYNVTASVQPIHLAADIPLIEKYWGERGRFAYAFGSLANSGARLIFGSDTPIESFDPWKAIYTALERKYLVNPLADSFHPEERITIDQAIQAYTFNSAWAVGEEMNLGGVEIGKQADLIMIDQDIFSESPEILLDTHILLTIMAGEVVYGADD
jgi:predicted amidohydrolase YtcJ